MKKKIISLIMCVISVLTISSCSNPINEFAHNTEDMIEKVSRNFKYVEPNENNVILSDIPESKNYTSWSWVNWQKVMARRKCSFPVMMKVMDFTNSIKDLKVTLKK